MPIMLALGSRSKRGQVAPEIAKTGFCATKQINFHGVRAHLIDNRKPETLPTPARIWLREGNVHDLTALREIKNELPAGSNPFADRAYADANFRAELQERKIKLLTPLKKPKKENLSAEQKRFSKTISSFRQPIKSFFKWLIEKPIFKERVRFVQPTDY